MTERTCAAVPLFLVIGLLFVGSCHAQGRQSPARPLSCTQLRIRANLLDASLAKQDDTQKRRSLLAFLRKYSDDPTDCVTTTIYTKLLDLERSKISLVVGSNAPTSPEWLLQCNSIKKDTQHCNGFMADDIPIFEGERIAPRFVAPLAGDDAHLTLGDGLAACKVTTISAAESTAIQNGTAVSVLSEGPGPFKIDGLKAMKNPMLLAVIKCGDELRYRKAAWVFSR